jgi:alkanesulfonate monooxygenase
MLTAISQNTSKKTLGTSAIILPYRNPIIVAKMLSTLDCFCNGRVVCTVAAGWMEEEFKILNAPYGERVDRTSEYIRIIKTLWEAQSVQFSWQLLLF